MRTGEVAEAAGVNIQTLRYYERRGLITEPPRRQSGYRIYASDTVRIVRFVKRAQELGFTLAEVEGLLDMAAGGPENCDAAHDLAMQKIRELGVRIASLKAMRSSLQRLAATCELPRSERECPIIESLAEAQAR
jgi:Hg(II)-responsive transcriptional regulator